MKTSASLVLVAALTALLVPIVVGAARSAIRMNALHEADAPTASEVETMPPEWQPDGRPLVAVVAGNDGTEVTDLVLPHAVLAESGAFDIVVVAPERRSSPLLSALLLDAGADVIPDLSFAEYDRRVGRAPDVLVVPYVPRRTGIDRAVVPWIARHVGPRTLLLTVCAGSELAAEAGLLDGRAATTHPSLLDRMRAAHPRVRWVRSVRFVEDDHVIASGGLSSGAHAALAVLRRALGSREARRVAERVGADPAFLEDPRYDVPPVGATALLAAAFGASDLRQGVAIDDGVDAMSFAAIVDAIGVSARAQPVAIAPTHRPVRTRQGLWLAPRSTDATTVEHLFLLAPAASRGPGPITRIGPGGYDEALRAFSSVEGHAAGAAAARSLLWPAPRLGGSRFEPLVTRPLALAALGALAPLSLARLGRRRERARSRSVVGS